MSHVRLSGTDLSLILRACPGIRVDGGRKVSSLDALAEDVQALRDRNVGLVVSCLTDAELSLGIEAYEAAYAAAGINWLRVAIPDMSPPGPETEPRLNEVLSAAREVMATGRPVAIHCMAGLGRTGTVAARLAMEDGLTAEDAIEFIRASHSRAAIETREQELYLMSLDGRTSG